MGAEQQVSVPRAARRPWRWVLGGSAIVVGLAALYIGYATMAARRDLERAIAQLNESDPGWTLEDIEAGRRVLADEENSALLVGRLSGELVKANLQAGASTRVFDELRPEVRLDAEQQQVLREVLAPLEKLREEALRLKDLPEGRFPITYAADFISTNIRHVQNSRQVLQLLHYEAMLRADEGDATGAVEAAQALLNTARAIGDEPFLVSMLVRFAGNAIAVRAVERSLAQGEPGAAARLPMQALLALEADEPLLTYGIRGERGATLRIFGAIASGTMPGAAMGGPPSGWGARLFDLLRPALGRGQEAHLRYMTRMVEISKLPVHEQGEAIAALETRLVHEPPLVRLLAPAVGKVAEAFARTQANLRCAQVAIAAERYRLERKSWPLTLHDLVQAGLFEEAPRDPYDAQPLRWRLLPDGAVVYSIGGDRRDNDGRIGHQGAPGSDQGVRLWHPALRRQPPQGREGP
jgi:hypothetical protein